MGMTDEDMKKLGDLLTAIKGYPDARRAAAEWKQVFRILQKSDLPASQVSGIVGMRDVARFSEVLSNTQTPSETQALPGEGAPDVETCRRALKAFRKRLAITRLDDESRISSHSPLSKGDRPSTSAIQPPVEWPQEVWQELARQGRLHYLGHGLYELPKP